MRKTFHPLILVWILPWVLLAPVIFGGQAIFWGTPSLQFLPWRWLAWQILRSGHLPLWNPLLGMGAPLMANYQVGLWYPLNWTLFILAAIGGVSWMAWGQTFLVALHLCWGGWGMARLTRALGWGELAQTVSGLAFGLSGYLVARAGFLSINAAVAWLPWLIWAVVTFQPEFWFRLTGITAMLLLAGHAQTAWYSLLLAGSWWVFVQVNEHSQFNRSGNVWQTIRNTLPIFGAVLLAIGLTAVQLIPTAEYLVQSQRASQVTYAYAMTYSFWPWHILNLISPFFFGSPVTGNYWGYANFWEDAVYIGMLPLLLALTTLHKPSRLVKFIWSIVAVSFLLALGRNTVVFPWLYRHLPTFDMFQAPARWTLWAVFGLCLLAGQGVEGWRRPAGRALYWTRLATAGAFAVSLGAGLAWWLFKDVHFTFIRAAALAGFWALGAGVLTLTRPEPSGKNSFWHGVAVFWLAMDLLLAGWGLNPATSLDFYSSSGEAGLPASGRVFLPPDDEYALKFSRFLRFDTFTPDVPWQDLRRAALPNLTILDGKSSANNFDPLVPARYAEWLDAYSVAEPAAQRAMLDLMGVTLLETQDAAQPDGVRFERRQSAFPRGWWVASAQIAPNAQTALEWVHSVDLRKTVILEQTEFLQPSQGHSGTAILLSEQPNRQNWQVSSPTDGFLVIADTWYPGWQVRVDGKPAPLLRADFLFRAIPISAGNHQVTIMFRPFSFWIGALVTILSSMLGFGLFVALKKR